MVEHKPLFERLKKEHSDDVLHEGLPEWLWADVAAWLEAMRNTFVSHPERLGVSASGGKPQLSSQSRLEVRSRIRTRVTAELHAP